MQRLNGKRKPEFRKLVGLTFISVSSKKSKYSWNHSGKAELSDHYPIYRQHGSALFALLVMFLVIILVFLFVGVTESAFEEIGFTRPEFAAILVLTLFGSFINIPVTRVTGNEPVIGYREVQFFGATYRIPVTARARVSTVVAINVGGAIIPILVSAYLLLTHASLVGYILVGGTCNFRTGSPDGKEGEGPRDRNTRIFAPTRGRYHLTSDPSGCRSRGNSLRFGLDGGTNRSLI